MSEFGNVFGPNELKELLELAKRGDQPQQPDIQPGDRVNYIGTQFPFLKNVKVDHIEIHRVGRVAALAYDDEIYKVYVDQVQKVEGEEV
ncbi:hypothetical protein D3C74_373820 [compost metagenome]